MSDRYKSKLREQLGFIERSCKLFDDGHVDEAFRIALQARVLFHDARRSTSLTSRLGIKDALRLLSTCEQLPIAGRGQRILRVAGTGLTGIRMGGGCPPRVCAHLGASKRNESIPFDDWWNEDIWGMGPGVVLTRRQLILVAADKDGGAHVDAALPEDYAAFAAAGTGGSFIENEDGTYSVSLHPVDRLMGRVAIGTHGPSETGLSDVHRYSLRQIGYELLNSPALNELAS